MTSTTRPDAAPPRRADQPLFAARKREPKYFALGSGTAAATTTSAPTTSGARGSGDENVNTGIQMGKTERPAHTRAQSYADPATTLRGAWERARDEG
ncbi:hypothetical protein V497_04371, partial [Pseudogymnoascus sp. VKM F-4516 (FW-969)]